MRTRLFALVVLCAILMGEVKAQYHSNIHKGDSAALLELYHALSGENWETSWDLNMPVEKWAGVRLSSEGRVVQLELGNNQLVGEIPRVIAKLNKLRRVDMRSNQLRGAIPDEIATLEELERLDLAHNRLEGAVPASLARLRKLRVLKINNNKLHELPDLSSLDFSVFDIQENRFDFGDLIPNWKVLKNYRPQAKVDQEFELGAQLGDEVIIEVSDQTPSNKYEWFLNGEKIKGEPRPKLRIKKVQEGDYGAYVCHISNARVPGLTLIRNTTFVRPVGIKKSTFQIPENSVRGSIVGSLLMNESTVSYTFSISGEDAENFELGGDAGNVILSSNAFDFETKSSYAIVVTATSSQGVKYTDEFNIQINDVNEAPTNLVLTSQSIDENLPAGSEVGLISVVDQDANDLHKLSIEGDDAGHFQLEGNKLISNVSFDYESQSSLSFTLSAKDIGGLVIEKNYTLQINDVNEAPTDVSAETSPIDENVTIGTVIGPLTIKDPDINDSYTITLSGKDAANFSVKNNNLVTAARLDFEQGATREFFLVARDREGLEISKKCLVTINDLNESPVVTLVGDFIRENAPSGSEVGTINVLDQDAGDSYNLVLKGKDAKHFELVGNRLVAGTSFDFEKRNTFQFSIIATDNDGLEGKKECDIFISDVNESPVDIHLSNTQVEENARDIVIGTLTASDEDLGDSHIFSIGTSDSLKFRIGGENGNQLINVEPFDFELQHSVELTITVTDAAGLRMSKAFVISILDVDDVLGVAKEDLISIYPNPTKGAFVADTGFTLEQASVQLTDLGGKEIRLASESRDGTRLHIQVDSQNLKPGIYLLKINSDAHHITKKVIISQ